MAMKKKTVKLTPHEEMIGARVTTITLGELQECAAELDRPVSWVIRKCIEIALPQIRTKPAREIGESAGERRRTR